MLCKPNRFTFLGCVTYILLITTIARVTAITSDVLSQETATTTQSVIITENSGSLYSADDLYQKALRILRALKPLPRKRFEFDETEPSLLLLSYRLLAKFIFSIFGLRSPIADNSEIGKSTAEYKQPRLIKAIELLEKAAFEYNHDSALFTLGELNFYAKYTHPRNLTAAIYYYRELANRSGNATAQHMIGFMYATGIGNVVQRDQGKALLYHTFAALGRDTAAEMTLGYRHLMGIGVPRSCEDAVFYYKRVADKAIEYYKSGPPGGRQLPPSPLKSRLYDEDGGVYGYGASGRGPGHGSKHGDQAVLDDILEFYHYSAENGDVTAQLGLGQLYYQGTRNINQNFQRAYKYLKNVANKYWVSENSIEDLSNMSYKQRVAAGQAAGILGRMYLRGEGVEQDNKTALKWFIRGAKLEDPAALNGLGMMYMEGIELTQSYEKAMNLFKLAADKEYSEAQVNLGLIFLLREDIQSAFECFRLAADQNHILAHYYLAKMYAEGLGGNSQDCAIAAAYYKLVSERGDWLHSSFSDAYKSYNTGDRDSALINYLLAAERGYELGQANAAWLLDQDKSRWHPPHLVPKSDPFREKLALIYWTRSANQGNVDSRVKMGDYYFRGFGTEVNYEKAAACYRVAAEELSAMAMWNLGWMHENGIGVTRDFHLAKRWYDQSLSTNPDAYLPVTLSLIKLYTKSFWNYITGHETSGDDSDESSKRLWWNPLFSSDREETDGSIISEVDERKEWGAVGPDGEQLIKNYNALKKGVDEFSEPSDIDEEYDDGEEYGNEDLIESLIILVICLLVGWLVYLRQLRWNQVENNRAGGDGDGARAWRQGGNNGADQADIMGVDQANIMRLD